MKTIIFLLAILLPVIVSAEELVFDQNWQLKYRVESGRIYNKNWQLKGYLQDGKFYDSKWQLKGRIEEGKAYDKIYAPSYKLKGYRQGDRLYDRTWTPKGYIKGTAPGGGFKLSSDPGTDPSSNRSPPPNAGALEPFTPS